MKTPTLALPLVLIVLGTLWFLKTTDILPATSSLIAIFLVVAGIVVLIVDGFNKQTVVWGPFLMYCGLAVYLVKSHYMTYSPILALGLVILGVFMLIARSEHIPYKKAPAYKSQNPRSSSNPNENM
ncbi:MAG: hypothetical protein KBC57_01575 [Neisseriaceae bacterium]|nr:hypothetical protein [Neisseriaceae bacterium]MBP6861030.1 hypothetical protein [Neisseriaceae bacterium]